MDFIISQLQKLSFCSPKIATFQYDTDMFVLIVFRGPYLLRSPSILFAARMEEGGPSEQNRRPWRKVSLYLVACLAVGTLTVYSIKTKFCWGGPLLRNTFEKLGG